jgi:excinuclease UvrABC nuclease subunit
MKDYLFTPELSTPNTFNKNFKEPLNCGGIYYIVHPKLNPKNRKIAYQILYIGSSANLKNRINNHDKHSLLTKKYKYVEFYFKESDNFLEIEKQLIKKYQPKYNKQWL